MLRVCGLGLLAVLVVAAGCRASPTASAAAKRNENDDNDGLVALFPALAIIPYTSAFNVLEAHGITPRDGPAHITRGLYLADPRDADRASRVLMRHEEIMRHVTFVRRPGGGTIWPDLPTPQYREQSAVIGLDAGQAIEGGVGPDFLARALTQLIEWDQLAEDSYITSVKWTWMPYYESGGRRTRAIEGELDLSTPGATWREKRSFTFQIYPDVGVRIY